MQVDIIDQKEVPRIHQMVFCRGPKKMVMMEGPPK